jgi:multiple sugar transport system substrate-binding protein
MAALKDAGSTAIQPSIDQTWYERWFDWYPLYLAAGNKLLLNEDASKAVFNDAAGKAAMGFWREVYANKYAPQATAEQDSYSQGKVAMRIAGPWATPDIEKGGLLDSTAVMPVWIPDDATPPESYPSTFADTKNIGIFSNCDDKDTAWEFVKFYVSKENDVTFLQTTQQIPLRTGIADAVDKKYFDDHPLLQSFAEQAEHTLNVDQSAKLTDIFGIISQAYQAAAIYSKSSVDDALKDAEDQVNSLIGG